VAWAVSLRLLRPEGRRKRPFSRSYRAILPSSLAMIHSSTLGFSPRPPVSVCGTGLYSLKLSGFSWKSDYLHYQRTRRLAVLSGFSSKGGFAYPNYSYTLQRTIPSVRGSVTTPSPHRSCKKYWNINQLSIGFPLRVHLRTRLTLIRLALIRKPWSFGGRVSRPPYRYLCLHLLFQKIQHGLRHTFSSAGMLPYRSFDPIASVIRLMPVYYPCPIARLVSCYALFK